MTDYRWCLKRDKGEMKQLRKSRKKEFYLNHLMNNVPKWSDTL